jgi:hypothetical protein
MPSSTFLRAFFGFLAPAPAFDCCCFCSAMCLCLLI